MESENKALHKVDYKILFHYLFTDLHAHVWSLRGHVSFRDNVVMKTEMLGVCSIIIWAASAMTFNLILWCLRETFTRQRYPNNTDVPVK